MAADTTRLKIPPQVADKMAVSALELAASSSYHLLYTSPEAGDVLMAGVLGEGSVTDLLSFFNMFRKTGVLHFELKGGCKDLYFQQGEVVSATSTFPGEDLGTVLVEMGTLSAEVLQKIRASSIDLGRDGKVLVEKGLVTGKDLWQAARQQVESIVYGLFAFRAGSYVFLDRPVGAGDIVRLSLSTQNLIMEGLRRVDEKELFMRRIGSFDSLPVLVPGRDGDLPPSEKRLALLIGERRLAVREILRRSGMGEFETLRLLHQLIERKVVRMEDAPSVEASGDLGKILSVFNGTLSVLFRRLSEKNPLFGQEVDRFLHTLPQPFSYVFRDVVLAEDGSIEAGRILINLDGLEESDKMKLLADALSELVYMECMAARRLLGASESTELIQRVQEISRRVKHIIGSK